MSSFSGRKDLFSAVDLFSAIGAAYARFRPNYPADLFKWLADVSPGRELAVDVGTGNGQAAVALAGFFQRVIGIEPSAGQLDSARPHDRVEYRQAAAEQLGLPEQSADLVLAAQAFHWFVADGFFAEARRVLRPGGVLALVSYGNCSVDPAVDALVWRLYQDLLGRYWEPERRLVETGYAHVQEPFGVDGPELMHAGFELRQQLDCDRFLGYLGTWSALKKFHAETGRDAIAEIAPGLRAVYAGGDPAGTAAVSWPLSVRAWRRP